MKLDLRLLVIVGALAMASAGCGPATSSPAASSSGSTAPSSSPVPSLGGQVVLVDTDVAPDDVMGLAYLLARPDLDLVAVTVSGTGEARCPDGVRVVRGVLERLGRADIPVACGRDTPLVGNHAFPAPWRDLVATRFGLDLPDPAGSATDLDAVGLLRRAADDAGGSLEVLTLGPLTNLGDAFVADPALAERIAGITIMGGAVLTAGNVGDPEGDGTSVNAEWNAYVDPRALSVVLGSGAPVTLVPLDATDDVPMTRQLALRIAANRGTEAAALVHELLARNPDRVSGTSLWDQTAAMLLADGPEGLTMERHRLSVIETEGTDSGRIQVDPDGTEALVAMAADSSVVSRRFVEGLNGGTAEAPVPSPAIAIDATFDGTTCAVSVPETAGAGFARLTFANDATVEAGVFVARLSGEATWDSLVALIERGPLTEEPAGVTAVATVGAAPGGSGDDVAPLDAGDYGVVCGSFSETGVSLAAGAPFTIEP